MTGRWVTAAATALVVVLTGCHDASPPPDDGVGPAIRSALDADSIGFYRNLRAMLVVVDGRTEFSRYAGDFTARTAVEVGGIEGPVLATLVGMALADGDLPGLDATLADLLPQRRAQMSDDAAHVTLRQVLTMTAGLLDDDRWHAEVAHRPGADLTRWLLRHGVVRDPGASYVYSDANSHLLAAVLDRNGGAAARAKLSAALAIPALREPGPLRLTVPELVTLGRLWADDGRYRGRSVVPPDWVNTMRRETVAVGDTAVFHGYGTGALTDAAAGHPAMVAADRGGHLVEVVPDLHLVAVFASRVSTDPAEQIGVAGPTAYADLVNLTIAPRLR